MRLRALALLLALTAGDLLAWHWSLATGHDVLALASGMTTLPLAALSAGWLGMTVVGLLARALRPQAVPSQAAAPTAGTGAPADETGVSLDRADASTGRLAA